MALGELDVEVGDQGLHVVVALDLQVEGEVKGMSSFVQVWISISLIRQELVTTWGATELTVTKKNQG